MSLVYFPERRQPRKTINPRDFPVTASIKIGILTISDRASQGIYEDKGGPAIREYLSEVLSCEWEVVARIIPDERHLIEQHLRLMCDEEKCCFIVTTGGTGPALRDVTPEATEATCEKMLPGFGEAMRAESVEGVQENPQRQANQQGVVEEVEQRHDDDERPQRDGPRVLGGGLPKRPSVQGE